MKTKNEKHTLYSNYYWEPDFMGKDMYDYTKEDLFLLYSEENNWDTKEDIPQENILEELDFQNEINFDNFKNEFNDFLSHKNSFLLTGTMGTWLGDRKGGFVFDNFEKLSKCWESCDYIKVYDKNGHLYIDCSHHDGNNHYEIKELTNIGEEFYENHNEYMDTQELHMKLWNNNFFSRLPHYWQFFNQ